MKARVVAQATIDASRAAVFRYLTTLEHHYLWNPTLQTISASGKLKQGSEYRTTSLLLGISVSGHVRVTKFVSSAELELQNDTGAIHYCVNYQLKGVGKQTVITCDTVVSSQSGAFAFSAPLLKILAQRELRTDMQALKLAVEQQLK